MEQMRLEEVDSPLTSKQLGDRGWEMVGAGLQAVFASREAIRVFGRRYRLEGVGHLRRGVVLIRAGRVVHRRGLDKRFVEVGQQEKVT